jgi:hypothetical protein
VCGWIHEKKGRKQKQSHSLRSGMLYSGSFKALFRLYSSSIKALFRLFSGSFQALFRLFSGSFQAQSHSLRSGVLY